MVDSLEIRVKDRNGKRPFCFVRTDHPCFLFLSIKTLQSLRSSLTMAANYHLMYRSDLLIHRNRWGIPIVKGYNEF